MTLTQLKYIISLDEHRNFVQASIACHVSQPTLSVQIQKIEDLLQVAIFDRSKHPIEPTLIGHKIIAMAREVTSNVRSIEQLVLDAKGIVQGEFKLAIIPSVAGSLIPLFLQKFTEKFFKVKLTILELKTDELIDMLKKDQIDAGIAATPLLDRELTESPLYWEPFYLFVNNGHPLFTNKSVSQKDLVKQNILLMSEGNCIRTQISQICRLKKSFDDGNRPVNFESGNFYTLIQLVKQNMGITLLPHLVATSIQAEKGMIKPFKGKIPIREIGLVTKRTLVKKTISDALTGIIKEVIPSELQQINKSTSHIISPI